MEIKKSKKAELESWRSIFFLIGVIITLSVLLAAFEWKSHPPKYEMNRSGGIIIDQEFAVNTKRQKPKFKKPVVLIDKFKLVDNNKLLLRDEIIIPEGWEDDLPFDSMPMEKEIEGLEAFYPFPQVPPKFPGDINEYLLTNTHYPVEARELGSQGTVYLKFEISSTGKVRKVVVVRGVDILLDKEAIRVIENMPRWEPAVQGDIKVATASGISIKFTLKN